MKKTILALGLIITLASCGGASVDATATKADSSVVAVDSVTKTISDSVKADTVKVKVK